MKEKTKEASDLRYDAANAKNIGMTTSQTAIEKICERDDRQLGSLHCKSLRYPQTFSFIINLTQIYFL